MHVLFFCIYRHYLHTVKMYIERGSDLKVLLGTLRIKFSELVKNSTEAISAMSFEWSLSGAISEVMFAYMCMCFVQFIIMHACMLIYRIAGKFGKEFNGRSTALPYRQI